MITQRRKGAKKTSLRLCVFARSFFLISLGFRLGHVTLQDDTAFNMFVALAALLELSLIHI